MSLSRISLGVFFFVFIGWIILVTSSGGIASVINFTIPNFVGDILFLIGILGFFSYTFGVSIFSAKIWKTIFWIYVIYLLAVGLLTSKDAIMIGSSGVAYSEIEEEGWMIFSIEIGIVLLGIAVLLFSIFRLGFYPRKLHKNKSAQVK